MTKTILFLSLLLTASNQLISQGSTTYWTPPKNQYSTAYKIEKIRKADCTIISYVLEEFNKTITPRDDRNIGPYYFVSGADCQKCFAESFAEMKFKEEEFLTIPSVTLDLNHFTEIPFSATVDVVAPGHTMLYRTYFHHDNATRADLSDDIYLGTDFIIESGDPDFITSDIDLSFIPEDYPDITSLKNIFSKHSYYKLRELIVNRNNIVGKLRKENKLIDITPKEPKIETIRLVKN